MSQSTMRKAISLILLALVAGSGFAHADGASRAEENESPRRLVADEPYSCGAHFLAKVLEGPKGAEDGDHPANRKLKRLLRRGGDHIPGPRHGWIRVFLSERRAEFVAEKSSGRAWYYIGLRKGDGRWRWAYSGDTCRPLAWGRRKSGGTLDLRDAYPPQPEDRSLRLLVHEIECHGYRVPEDEDIHPEVIYGKENVVVIVRIDWVEGGANCPGTPPFRYTVELDEPLGDRALVDAGEYPPDVLQEAPSSSK